MKYGELKSKILLVLSLGTMAGMSSVYAANGPLVITQSDTVTREGTATYVSDATRDFGISFSEDGTNGRTYTLKAGRLEAKGSQAGIGVAGDTLVVKTTQGTRVEGRSSGIYVGWANSSGIPTYPGFPTYPTDPGFPTDSTYSDFPTYSTDPGIENTPKSSVTIQSQGDNEIRQTGMETSDIFGGISLQGDVTFALESTSGNNTVKSDGGHGLLVGTANNPTVGGGSDRHGRQEQYFYRSLIWNQSDGNIGNGFHRDESG